VRVELAAEAVEAIARRAAEMVLATLDARAEVRERPYLTPAEAARVAGVSPRTIRAWFAAGRLRRHGGSPRRPLVERAELVALLDGRKPPPDPPPPAPDPAPRAKRGGTLTPLQPRRRP
jgi:hypothetical protein